MNLFQKSYELIYGHLDKLLYVHVSNEQFTIAIKKINNSFMNSSSNLSFEEGPGLQIEGKECNKLVRIAKIM